MRTGILQNNTQAKSKNLCPEQAGNGTCPQNTIAPEGRAS
jgi:hypothetical protein